MYEVLSTRAGRRQQYVRDMADAIASLEKVEAVDFVGDEAYREDCLLSMFRESSGPRLRDLSLADRVIRSILGDPEIRVQALLTSNVKDFADVCRNRRVTLEDLNG